MTFEKSVKELNRVMGFDVEMKQVFGKPEPIRNTIKLATSQIKASMEDKSVILSDKDGKAVYDLVKRLLHHAILGEHTPLFRDFAFHAVKVLGNWNNAVAKNSDITLRLQTLDRIMRDAKTMKDMEMTMKALIRRSAELVRYQPPMFDVSRHYLKSLLEENKG